MLEDCADCTSQLLHPPGVFVCGKLSVKPHLAAFDRAAIDSLKAVEAAQQRRLAAA